METTAPRHSWRNTTLLFLGASFVAFFQCLVMNKAYFANDLLYGFGAQRAFLKAQLALGHFPLWNPYLFGGQPFFADPNAMMAYPLNYLTLLFPLGYGYGVFFFLHMALAGLGVYYWLRNLRLTETACRLGGLTFALSGLFWWELIHPSIIASLTWFAWVLGAVEALAKEPTPRKAFLVGFFYALLFTSGSFEIALGAFYTAFFYFCFRATEKDGWAASLKNVFAPANRRNNLLVALFALWGALPLFAHLVPAGEFSNYSNRESDAPYDQFSGTFSMVPFTAYEFVFPNLGVPQGQTIEEANQDITNMKTMDNDFLGVFGFAGVWAPLLAFFAFQRKDKKVLWLLLVLGAVSILVSFGRYFPLHQLLCDAAPGFKLLRAPFRFINTYVFCICALSAFGFQSLEQSIADKTRASQKAFIALLYGILLLFISFIRLEETWAQMLALAFGLAGFSLWGWTQSWKPLGKYLVLGALVIPMFLSAWTDYSTGDPSNFDYQGKYPATSTLGPSYPLSRFYLDAQTIGYPVETGDGVQTIVLPQNIAEVWGMKISSGYSPIYLKSVSDLGRLPQSTYLWLMAIRGLLVGKDAGDQKGYVKKPLDSIYEYESDNPPPFLWTPSQVQVMPDEGQIDFMRSTTFNPQQELVVSSPLSEPPAQGPVSLQYNLKKDDPDDQDFQVQLGKESPVVFSEADYPGWKAFVDGRPTTLFQADHALRGLVVPAGSHEVEFRYEPSWAKPLLIGLILWLASVLAYGVFLFTRKKGPAPQPAQA